MDTRPPQSPPPIESYKTIANNMSEKISHRLVVDGEKIKSYGLWGRFVMFLSELGRPSKFKSRNNAVVNHLENAIKDSYSGNTLKKTLDDLENLKHKLQNENRSLRDRDVRNLLLSGKPKLQDSSHLQYTDYNRSVSSSQQENFETIDPEAQHSENVKDLIRNFCDPYMRDLLLPEEKKKPKLQDSSHLQYTDYNRSVSSSQQENFETIDPEAQHSESVKDLIRNFRDPYLRDFLLPEEKKELELQDSSHLQYADYDRSVSSSQQENFETIDPIAQLSQEIKDVMTLNQLERLKSVMSSSITLSFKEDNRLSMDQICALVLAIHFKDTAKQVQAATGVNAEENKYSFLSPLLDEALNKIWVNDKTVRNTTTVDPSKLTNHFTDNLGTEKIHTSLFSEQIQDISNKEFHMSKYDQSTAIVSYNSDVGKLVNLGEIDDYDYLNCKYIVFKPGSRHIVKEVEFFKVEKTDRKFEVYNNNDDDDDPPYKTDEYGNLIGACMVVINVT